MDFDDLARAIHKQKGSPLPDPHCVTLCFDPGHTTGWAAFAGTSLTNAGEIVTKPIEAAVSNVDNLIETYTPDIVVIEDYRIYKWRAKHHVGSEMLTTRVIGCIETLCVINGISPIIKQPAHVAKKFCTDSKLRAWVMYRPGQKHARDAIRHGCYFLLHGAVDKKQRKGVTVG